jgi:sugar fermentation stimulation protein A
MNTLYVIPNMVQARVVSRPSKSIKSPYVADMTLANTDTNCLGHTASLGCGGLANSGATVYAIPTEGNKCDYRIMLSRTQSPTCSTPTIVGIFPKLAEDLVERALTQNCIPTLQNISWYRRETAIHIEGEVHSRFDFSGADETGREFILEVKNVPLAHDVVEKIGDVVAKSNRAYFPDGYRKSKTDTVSERALKHVRELQRVIELQHKRAILCFVVQRDDVDAFETAPSDPIYRDAVKEANAHGVEVIVLHVGWRVTQNEDGNTHTATAVCLPSELRVIL